MGTLIVHQKNKEQLSVLKAFMNALEISFEEKDEYSYDAKLVVSSTISEVNESEGDYNSEFVNKIKKSDDEFKSGKFTAIKTTDLWK